MAGISVAEEQNLFQVTESFQLPCLNRENHPKTSTERLPEEYTRDRKQSNLHGILCRAYERKINAKKGFKYLQIMLK